MIDQGLLYLPLIQYLDTFTGNGPVQSLGQVWEGFKVFEYFGKLRYIATAYAKSRDIVTVN